MCLYAGIETGSEIISMAESVFARFLSNKKEDRILFSTAIKHQKAAITEILNNVTLEKALFLCKIISFIQGFNVLKEMKIQHKWKYSIVNLCKVWRNGCILRCKLLDELKELSFDQVLVTSDLFLKYYHENIEALKMVCNFCTSNDIYAPVFTGCLMWLNGMKMDEKNGTLIQAMRDYFGRHGVVMKSGQETNIDWD